MTFEGALIEEQGVEFAIIVVKPSVLNNVIKANKFRNEFRDEFSGIFPNVPIILMAQNSKGVATYQGEKHIVNFLASLPISAIPWQRFTI